MKLRIVSDGTREGTRVETEDGEQVEGVQLLSWSFDCTQETSEAMLHLWGTASDLTVSTVTIINDDLVEPNPFPINDPELVIDISEMIKRKQ